MILQDTTPSEATYKDMVQDVYATMMSTRTSSNSGSARSGTPSFDSWENAHSSSTSSNNSDEPRVNKPPIPIIDKTILADIITDAPEGPTRDYLRSLLNKELGLKTSSASSIMSEKITQPSLEVTSPTNTREVPQ
jgi:hypothetical protein